MPGVHSKRSSQKTSFLVVGLGILLLAAGLTVYWASGDAQDLTSPAEGNEQGPAGSSPAPQAGSNTSQIAATPLKLPEGYPLPGPSAGVGDRGTRAPSEVPIFSEEDIAAARRLEPGRPRSVVWDRSCQKEDLPSGIASLSPESMVRSIKDTLRGHQEFPEGVHVVRWEMAFGLPRSGVVVWAEWLGTRPATYRVLLQDSREPKETWDASGMAPVKTVADAFDWEATRSLLVQTKQELQTSVGLPDYRRVIATSETDDGYVTRDAGAHGAKVERNIIGVELLGARVLWYSEGLASCLRREDNAMVCFCGRGQHVDQNKK